MKLILFLSLILSFNAFSMEKKRAKTRTPPAQQKSEVGFNIYLDRISSVKSEFKVEKEIATSFLGLVGSGYSTIYAYSDFGGKEFKLDYMKSIKLIIRYSNPENYMDVLQDCENYAQQNLLFGRFYIRVTGDQYVLNSQIKNYINGKVNSIEITINENNKFHCGAEEY